MMTEIKSATAALHPARISSMFRAASPVRLVTAATLRKMPLSTRVSRPLAPAGRRTSCPMAGAPMFDDLLQRRPYNAAADLLDANVERGLGGKVAVTDSERSLTYAELQACTYRFAAALKSLGLRQEERIALLMPDTVDWPVVFLGGVRAG